MPDTTPAAKNPPVRRFFNHLKTKLRKRLGLRHGLDELDPYLAAKPLHFHAPQLTPDLVEAIRLISPQFRLRPDEESRRFWELNQNGLCWGEYEALEPFLDHLGKPEKVLDVGPGMGRSAVFFKDALGWEDVPFHLYEGSGESTKYTKAGPRFDDSFCGTISVLDEVLEHNLGEEGMETVEIFDAADLDADLGRLPGPYDFIYSFFAVGFHWSIEHFLDEILGLMRDRSVGAFTLHDRFDDFSVLGDLPYRVVDFRRSWPQDRWTRMLVLAKEPGALP